MVPGSGFAVQGESARRVGKKLTADDMRQWIIKPTEMAAKNKSVKKPPMQDKCGSLPAADLDALVAYMRVSSKETP